MHRRACVRETARTQFPLLGVEGAWRGGGSLCASPPLLQHRGVHDGQGQTQGGRRGGCHSRRGNAIHRDRREQHTHTHTSHRAHVWLACEPLIRGAWVSACARRREGVECAALCACDGWMWWWCLCWWRLWER
jgi:hypothetical protein